MYGQCSFSYSICNFIEFECVSACVRTSMCRHVRVCGLMRAGVRACGMALVHACMCKSPISYTHFLFAGRKVDQIYRLQMTAGIFENLDDPSHNMVKIAWCPCSVLQPVFQRRDCMLFCFDPSQACAHLPSITTKTIRVDKPGHRALLQVKIKPSLADYARSKKVEIWSEQLLETGRLSVAGTSSDVNSFAGQVDKWIAEWPESESIIVRITTESG